MSVPPDVARVLAAAADVIEERGWCQGHMSDDEGHVCAIDAIWRAGAGGLVSRMDVELAFEDALGGGTVAEWNDAPGRTKAEVVAKLREVAGSAA